MKSRPQTYLLLAATLAALSATAISLTTHCENCRAADDVVDDADCCEAKTRYEVDVVIDKSARGDQGHHYSHRPMGYSVEVRGAGITVENFLETGDGERASILRLDGNTILRLRSTPYVYREYFWGDIERSHSSVECRNELHLKEIDISGKTFLFLYTRNCVMRFIVKDGLVWPVSGTTGFFGLAWASDSGIVGGEDIDIIVKPDGIWPVTEDDIEVLRAYQDIEFEGLVE